MKTLFVLLACLLLLACGSETKDADSQVATHETEQTKHEVKLADATVEVAVRNVSCGCAIDEIGHCGNYVEIDSRYVEIGNSDELALGPMEWCGKSGVQAETAGEIKDGKFVATKLVVVE
jgi:hypothetical protein